MKLKRIFSRIIFHLLKFFIKGISLFNHRMYMKLYIPLLKLYGMKIKGSPRYIGADVIFDDINKIKLGERVVISNECHFLTHDYSITTALIAVDKKPLTDIAIVRRIEVGDNVFIGKKSIIMPGTIVGDNVIVGAGTVLRGKIESGSIIIGNPSQKVGDIYEQAKKWEKYLNTNFIRKDK